MRATVRFDPVDLDAAERELVELEQRPLPDRAALEAWIDDWARVHDRLDEARVRREIAKDQALDDEAVQAAHRDWTAEAEPRFKPRFFALQQKLALHQSCDELDPSYGRFVRKVRNQVRLYHPAAAAVQAECDGLVADFYRVRGAQAAQCEWGDSDRARREGTFKEMVAERGRDQASLDAIVDGLLDRRRAIARQAGCADFREYRFRQLNRFDYGPGHCLRMCEAVEKAAMPLLGRLDGRRARRLGVEALRPWDVEAEAAGLEPLVPFETFGDVLPRVRRVLEKLHAPFAADLDFLLERQLLDLEPRPHKSAFVGYQQFLRPEGLPYIFANIRPAPSALNNLFHELGHASHSLAFRRLPLAWNRDVPLEFGETMANAFQLICGGLLQGVFYDEEQARRARLLQWESLVDNLVYTARGETFLHWVHGEADADAQERGRVWRRISRRLGRGVDWSGYEEYQGRLYVYEIPHFFFAPFYWIEYLYGQLGALQLWRRFREDREGAMEGVQRAMALGGTASLPELFAAAGIAFEVGPGLLADLVGEVEAEMDALSG